MVFICTLQTCSVEKWGYIHYQPSIPGNSLFLAILIILLFVQIYLGIHHRTYSVTICFCLGLLMEVIGYAGRLLLHNDPFWKPWFLMYLVDLTIGPTLIAAGIYLSMARIVVVYDGGEKKVARWKPASYTLVFLGWDTVSLVFQAIGGIVASIAPIFSTELQIGVDIMIVGLAIQVASLLLFIALCSDLAWRVHKYKHNLNQRHADLYQSHKFKVFLRGLALATFCIFVRSIFRVVELSEGFGGSLANNQISFMILEGTMVVIASSTLTILHPGVGFGKAWQDANFQFPWGKKTVVQVEIELRNSHEELGNRNGKLN